MKLEQVIGARIKTLREGQGISQAELGSRMEPWMGRAWTRQAVSSAEKGARDFGAAELVAFAAVLRTNVAYLFSTTQAAVEMPGKSIAALDLYELTSDDLDNAAVRYVSERLNHAGELASKSMRLAIEASLVVDECRSLSGGDVA